MFAPNVYANSRPDGFSVLEVVEDTSDADAPRLFVPLKRTELTGEIMGPLAALRLVQTYGYTHAQCDHVLEALYRFPLPGDAAVTKVTLRFGEVEIVAELKAREQAEADYETARQQGQQAALATRESPDVFTLQIAGLQPDQEITVETHYVQLARAEGQGWTLRIPLTTAPRYVRSDEVGSRYAAGQPLALLRDPGHRFALSLTLHGARAATSPTHSLTVSAENEDLRVTLQDGEVLPDRDCVLAWQPVQETQHPALHVLLHEDAAADQVYFLAQVAPPAARSTAESVPRECILLVDHSGSMNGPKWAASDWAVKQFLNGLTAQDTFALGLFHSHTFWFARKVMRGEAGAVAEAIRFLEAHKDSGGTELGVALEQALSLERSAGERARYVLILTDAQVSDEGRILRLASEEAKQSDRRRISVLCIDSAPNAFLAQALAERGGGVARFLTSAPEEEDITTALDTILEDWTAPLLTGLRLEINRPGAQAVGRNRLPVIQEGGSTLDLGDLPAGRALWVAGCVPRGTSPDLSFRVRTAHGREVAACRRDLTASEARCPAIKALFGARRVQGLEFLIHSGYTGAELTEQLQALGYDAQEIQAGIAAAPAKVYAENTRAEAEKWLHQLLVRESLNYGLACSETAFIAVRTEAGKPVEGTVVVANALPAGWSETVTVAGRPMMLFHLAVPPAVGGRADFAMPSLIQDSGMPDSAGSASAAGERTRGGGFLGLPRFKRNRAKQQSQSQSPAAQHAPLFSGAPVFVNGRAVLFDSSRAEDKAKLSEAGLFSSLTVRFPDGNPDLDTLDPGLALLLYVEDLAAPRAHVRLADLIRQGGTRPLNITHRSGQVVWLVLTDAAGAWAQDAPSLEITLT
jgi:Ca-activated chloride channel family protein